MSLHLPQMIENTNHPALVVSHLVNAPCAAVWKAWTESEQLPHWFGPKGFKMSVRQLELRPGGVLHYCLRSPDGHEMWGKWIFRETVEAGKLVVVVSFSDADGGVTRHPLSATWPLETLSTTTFTERNGTTEITLAWAAVNATADEQTTFNQSHDGMRSALKGTLDQLSEYLTQTQRSS